MLAPTSKCLKVLFLLRLAQVGILRGACIHRMLTFHWFVPYCFSSDTQRYKNKQSCVCPAGEPFEMLDLDSLLNSVCADAADAGQAVEEEGKVQTSVNARPGALRLCLTNILNNAVKYGHQASVLVTCKTRGNAHCIGVSIHDCTSGMSPLQLSH